MIINNYFPQTPVKISSIKLETPESDLNEYANEIYRLGDSMNRTTNLKGTMTTYKVFQQTNKFNKILQEILNICNSFLLASLLKLSAATTSVGK